MDFEIINGYGMWVACAVMVLVTLIQSSWFFAVGLKRAKELQIPMKDIKSAVRASSITVIGPTLATVIALFSLIVVVGAPMGWMRVNDIGAARTEVAAVTMVQSLVPAGVSDLTKFTYAAWAMALNNMGWMLVALVFTPQMEKILDKMKSKFDARMIVYLMEGAGMGLFAYLLGSGVVGKASPAWISAAVSIITMVLISKYAGKSRILTELSFGIAMIAGMAAATVVFYLTK